MSTNVNENDAEFFAEYFDKLAETEEKIEEYIRVVTSMLDHGKVDMEEVATRTQIVSKPINSVLHLSGQYLMYASGMVLQPSPNTHSDHLLHLLDVGLMGVLMRVFNTLTAKGKDIVRLPQCIVGNDALRLSCDNTNATFVDVLKGLYNDSKCLVGNIRDIKASFATVDAEAVSHRFNAMYDEFCKQNAYLASDIQDEVDNPSAAIAELMRSQGERPIIMMWKKYKQDIPTLIRELRRDWVVASELNVLFNFRLRYETLLKMKVASGDDGKTININNPKMVKINTSKKADKGAVKKHRPEYDVPDSPFVRYMSDPSRAAYTLEWLHDQMDGIENAKDKLAPLRGLIERGVFKRTIPHCVYVQEFGYMSRSSYSNWMKKSAKYEDFELENAVKSYKLG